MKAYPQDSDGRFMDLRDYFAARAMQGILTDENFHYAAWDNSPDWTEKVAMYAYEMADAMMEARK